MTPQEQKEVSFHLREVAKILYRNSDPAAIQTLAGIEETVRAQLLEHVGPELGSFFASKSPEPIKDVPENSKAS